MAKSTTTFPTRFEFRCSGCSFIISQLLMLFAMFMYSIDFDAYDVENEEQVVKLHNILSSSKHRTQSEFAVAAIWCAYPLLLVGVFGLKKFLTVIHTDESEMFIFAAIQSYLILITIVCIIIPACVLTTTSFEWSFHEYTPEPDFVATGYYIQLYLTIFTAEIIDCVAVADAVFMISLFILVRILLHDSVRFKKILKPALDPELPNCLKDIRCLIRCCSIMSITFAVALFIIFCMILFEFAESGFFSPTGGAKFLLIVSFMLKILMGMRLAYLGFSKKYDHIKRVFDDEEKILSAGDGTDYKMEPIGVGTDDKKESDQDAL